MYPVCFKEGRCVIWSAEIERTEVIHHDMVYGMDEGLKNDPNL
jgi:hypothetical protein